MFFDLKIVDPKIQATDQGADGLPVGAVAEELDGRARVNTAFDAVEHLWITQPELVPIRIESVIWRAIDTPSTQCVPCHRRAGDDSQHAIGNAIIRFNCLWIRQSRMRNKFQLDLLIPLPVLGLSALGLVRAGDADIALVYAYPGGGLLDDVDVVRRELLHDPLRLVLPQGDARAADESVDLAAFADEPWIAGSRSQAALRHVCARAGFEPRIAFATDDNVAVLGLVAAGLGVALATELVLSTASNRGVVSRPLTIPVQRSVATITVPDAERVPAVRAFADALVAAAHGIATTTAIDPAAAPA